MTFIIIILGIAATITLSSCNTISGIGKDVEAAGSKLDEASQSARQSM